MPKTVIEEMAPTTLAAANRWPRGLATPSPINWRDQVLYFLLPDRFSDGQEDQRPLYDRDRPAQFAATDRLAWMKAGRNWQGGTIRGINRHLGYLQDLGVTALWVGPVWRQRVDLETYHGYGIQNFLDVDPHFGTRQDLRDLVDAAHARGMYVILDVIYNHTGNNWFYSDDNGNPATMLPYRFAPAYQVHGWRSAAGQSQPVIVTPDDGVWPLDFQDPAFYHRNGQIGRWDPASWEDPLHPDDEFRRGDFFDLKDLDHDGPASGALSALIAAYQYWVALSDCDGFRIDTVKHVSWEASRNFCGAIREYAEAIGKNFFWLLGEVTGGEQMCKDYLDVFGRNIEAVLDLGDPAVRLANMVKGFGPAGAFFEQFGGHDILGSHRETGRYHVSTLDDHDMVGRTKRRFASGNSNPIGYAQTAHAVATQLTTLGVPCIYYGTEQAFDGAETDGDPSADAGFEDRYIREGMFGGTFGAFRTQGCHFFDANHPTYLRIAAVARVRNRRDLVGMALRRGRQYLRATSVMGGPFGSPNAGELAAWSRIMDTQEVLVALNTNGGEPRGAEVTVDAHFHPAGSTMAVLYRGDWSDAELRQPPGAEVVTVERHADGRSVVRIELPASGMAILA